MKSFSKLILQGILIVSVFTSCINSEKIRVGQIENFSVTKFSPSKIECKSAIEIVNETMWPITLKNKEMLIYSGNSVLGKVHFNDVIKISSHSSNTYDFQFSVEITNVQLGFSSIVNNVLGQSSEYRLKGNISACSLLICKNIEVNEVLLK